MYNPIKVIQGVETILLDQTLDLNTLSSLCSYDNSLSYTIVAIEGGSTYI